VLGVIALTATEARAGDSEVKKALAELDRITGDEATQSALLDLLDKKSLAKDLVQSALPAAKNKELSYNAALILGLLAAEQKELKSSEAYFRVCMAKAVKLQSYRKLQQAYGEPIDFYYRNKQYADAARICKELLELNTDDGKERVVIATIVDRFGEVGFSEEQDGFNVAQRLRPQVFDIYVKATAKQGKFDQAIKLVDGAIKRTDDWRDRQLKGWVLREANRLEESAAVYEGVIREVAGDERYTQKGKDLFIKQFRYEVSNVYIELKKVDRASEHLEFLVKKYPKDAIFANDLGYIWADNDMRLEEAEKLIRKAIDLDREERKKEPDFNPKTDQDRGAYLDSLGWVLFKQKKSKEAKEWLIKALEDKTAQHIEIFEHLGDVHMALGERDQAIRAYEGGLKAVTENRRDQLLKTSVEKKLAKLKGSK
jgi:tetratricopeptide (TPR) repeat protein